VAAAPVVPAAGPPAIAAPQHVTLVTGDVVTVSASPDGRQQASVLRQSPTGPGGQFQMFNLGADLYVVPQSAVPYLGTTMDLGLFDVTKLAAAAAGSTTTTVQVTYRSSTTPSAVPGIRITQRSGTTAQGVVTPESGRAFGAALADQWLADHASPTHTTGLFASVARVGTSAAPVVQPQFAMHTLTINGRDGAGKKDNGDSVLVYNVDDLRAYAGSASFIRGLAKVSVPAGHYAALSFFYDFPARTVRGVWMPQFAVTKDAAITLDARSATSPVSIATPHPAVAAVNVVAIGRDDAVGGHASYTFLGDGTTSFVVQPTTKAITVGQLHYYVYSRQFSAPGAASPYSYDLEFPSDGGIASDQQYVVHDSDLAAVASAYPAAHPDQQALDTRFGALPWQLFLFAADLTLTTPTQRTEYYSALPSLNWQGVYYSVFDDATFTLLGAYQSAWRTYSPGTSLSTTWAGQPQHPRLLEGDIFIGETVCPACISGARLDLLAYPFADNSPEHFGFTDGAVDGLTESVSYGVYADDVPIKTGGFLDTEATIPPGTQRYRIDYDTIRSSATFTLSTDVQTRWTVPATVAVSSLPPGWVCTYRTGAPTDCGVLPLTTAAYDLPVDLLGQLGSGTATGTLRLGHLAGASSMAFSTVKVKVSYDSGQTWQAVTVTDQGSGNYGIALTVPAAGSTDGFGALQISSRDAAGGTFDQTIQHAFAIAAS
jgi:hypothetical protein